MLFRSGIYAISAVLCEPIVSGCSWQWEDLAVSHGSGWLPGLGLDMVSKDRTFVVDGIRDLWYYLINHSLGGLTEHPDSMCTDGEEGDLVTAIVTHLFTHARDIMDTMSVVLTLLGRCDVLWTVSWDSISECRTNLTRAKVKSVYRLLSNLSVQQMEIDSDESRMRALVSQIFADQMEVD